MIENTTVTLPLDYFDELRAAQKGFKEIRNQLSHCFDYSYTENPLPPECRKCKHANESASTIPRRKARDVDTDLDAIIIELKQGGV